MTLSLEERAKALLHPEDLQTVETYLLDPDNFAPQTSQEQRAVLSFLRAVEDIQMKALIALDRMDAFIDAPVVPTKRPALHQRCPRPRPAPAAPTSVPVAAKETPSNTLRRKAYKKMTAEEYDLIKKASGRQVEIAKRFNRAASMVSLIKSGNYPRPS